MEIRISEMATTATFAEKYSFHEICYHQFASLRLYVLDSFTNSIFMTLNRLWAIGPYLILPYLIFQIVLKKGIKLQNLSDI